ncbi:MAG: DUF4349 domain-containing protein [Methanoregula sp.]|jgi:hypothetical protein
MKYKILTVLILFIAIVTVTGCTGVGNSLADTRTTSVQGAISPANYAGSGIYSEKVMQPAIATPVPTSVHDSTTGIDTKIIKTAYITVEVKDVAASVESLRNLAAERSGYLSSTSMQKGYNDRLSGTVIVRVPAAEFENLLTGVKALGTVKSVSTQGQDVTEEYVDLVAQKTSYQNQLAQYNTIMKRAEKVEDVITVQQQIDRVQTELNRIEGRMNYLNNRIDLSTITVTLQEPEPVGGQTGYNFIATINEGIAGFIGMIDAIIVTLFTLLPLIIIGGAAYGIYRWKKGKKPVAAPAELKKE